MKERDGVELMESGATVVRNLEIDEFERFVLLPGRHPDEEWGECWVQRSKIAYIVPRKEGCLVQLTSGAWASTWTASEMAAYLNSSLADQTEITVNIKRMDAYRREIEDLKYQLNRALGKSSK